MKYCPDYDFFSGNNTIKMKNGYNYRNDRYSFEIQFLKCYDSDDIKCASDKEI